MVETLIKIELVSTVRAARIERETARLKPEGNPPTGETNAMMVDLLERFKACRTEWSRLQVIKDAQDVLAQLRKGGFWDKKRGSDEWKQAIAMDTRASAIVAVEYGISASYVRRIRSEALMR